VPVSFGGRFEGFGTTSEFFVSLFCVMIYLADLFAP
jgi:hypothetical protein